MAEQSRGAERLPLGEGIPGRLADQEVRILEISLIGARIEHTARLAIGAQWTLQFKWQNTDLKIRARVTRTELRPAGKQILYLSGLQFAASIEEAPEELRRAMASHVGEEIAQQQKWEPPPFFRMEDDEDEDEQAPAEAEPDELRYLTCTLEDGQWTLQRTASLQQPREGFSMLVRQEAEAGEYCRTYEVADPETRRLIRLSLELAIARDLSAES